MIAPAYMNNQRLGEIIKKQAAEVHEDQLGYWRFEYANAVVLVVTDEFHNRMRIMTPIGDLESVSNEMWLTMLRANFDRALDARYCVNDQTLWSAYIHPLAELGSEQFVDGLKQVVALAQNFGTSFSSSDLVFGG